MADLSPDKRYEQRLKQAKPVLDALLAWVNARAAAPKSALGGRLPDRLKNRVTPLLPGNIPDGCRIP